jgi:hypothetical protein
MTLISPQLTLEQAQFVVNVLNEIPLPGIQAKSHALAVQVALGNAPPYEPEPEEPPEDPDPPIEAKPVVE